MSLKAEMDGIDGWKDLYLQILPNPMGGRGTLKNFWTDRDAEHKSWGGSSEEEWRETQGSGIEILHSLGGGMKRIGEVGGLVSGLGSSQQWHDLVRAARGTGDPGAKGWTRQDIPAEDDQGCGSDCAGMPRVQF